MYALATIPHTRRTRAATTGISDRKRIARRPPGRERNRREPARAAYQDTGVTHPNTAHNGRQKTFVQLVDAKEAAKLLGVPNTWVLAQARANRIPHHRLGHYVRFDPEDIARWLEETRSGATNGRRA